MEIIKPRAKINRVEKQYFPDTKARQRHDLKKGNYRLISIMNIYIKVINILLQTESATHKIDYTPQPSVI